MDVRVESRLCPGMLLLNGVVANTLKIKAASYRAAGQAYPADQRDPEALHAWGEIR